MDTIAKKRKEIDAIDDSIMALLNKRFDLALEIGDQKKKENINVLDTNREEKILNKTSNFSHSPQIDVVYKSIMSESKKLQRK